MISAVLLTLLHTFVFFSIGLLGAFFLVNKRIIRSHFIPIAIYAIGCFAYYVLFYLYALSPTLGSVATIIMYVCGVLAALSLAFWMGKKTAVLKVFKSVFLPFFITIVVIGSMYSVATFSCVYRNSSTDSPWIFYKACVLYDATGDNILPQLFGQQLIDNREYEVLGDWYLADRPPIEVGGVVSLLDAVPPSSVQASAYEFFSIILQLSWVAALWALLVGLGASKRNMFYVIIVSALTGFYYYNSIYGWPKMLAASFGIAGLALLLYNHKSNGKTSNTDWVLASFLLSLSMLSHGSSVYFIIPLVIYLVVSKRLPTIKTILLCALVVALTYGPWAIYQSRAAPNPRLAKWQLAGISSVEDKRSVGDAIVDVYSNTSISQWLSHRAENVGSLFISDYKSYWSKLEDPPTDEPFLVHVAKDPTENSLLDRYRKQEFFALIPALGLLNIAWPIMLYRWARKESDFIVLKPMIVISIIGIVCWVLLSFSPGSTLNFTNSYAIMIMIFTISLHVISKSSAVLRNSILALQFFVFYIVWVYGLYQNNFELLKIIPVTVFMLLAYALALRYYFRIEE